MADVYTRTQASWVDYPSTTTPIDAVDLENYDQGLLATNNDVMVLFYNGSTYLPKNGSTTAKAATGKPRLFIGSVDPATVSGVVLATNDRWDQTA